MVTYTWVECYPRKRSVLTRASYHFLSTSAMFTYHDKTAKETSTQSYEFATSINEGSDLPMSCGRFRWRTADWLPFPCHQGSFQQNRPGPKIPAAFPMWQISAGHWKSSWSFLSLIKRLNPILARLRGFPLLVDLNISLENLYGTQEFKFLLRQSSKPNFFGVHLGFREGMGVSKDWYTPNPRIYHHVSYHYGHFMCFPPGSRPSPTTRRRPCSSHPPGTSSSLCRTSDPPTQGGSEGTCWKSPVGKGPWGRVKNGSSSFFEWRMVGASNFNISANFRQDHLNNDISLKSCPSPKMTPLLGWFPVAAFMGASNSQEDYASQHPHPPRHPPIPLSPEYAHMFQPEYKGLIVIWYDV